MRQKGTRFTRGVFFTVLACTFLCLGMGAGGNPDQSGAPARARRPAMPDTPEIEKMMVDRIVGNSNFGMSDLSLEKRENDDFLLTPALLVQEAVSDRVVLTYPEE